MYEYRCRCTKRYRYRAGQEEADLRAGLSTKFWPMTATRVPPVQLPEKGITSVTTGMRLDDAAGSESAAQMQPLIIPKENSHSHSHSHKQR